MLLTAQREGEVCRMRPEVLEFQLKEGITSPWLFPSPRGEQPILHIHKAAARIRLGSNVDFRPHDFRRTASTEMASLDVSSFIIGKILNHADKSVTSIYDRYSYDAEKKGALETWETRLGQTGGVTCII